MKKFSTVLLLLLVNFSFVLSYADDPSHGHDPATAELPTPAPVVDVSDDFISTVLDYAQADTVRFCRRKQEQGSVGVKWCVTLDDARFGKKVFKFGPWIYVLTKDWPGQNLSLIVLDFETGKRSEEFHQTALGATFGRLNDSKHWYYGLIDNYRMETVQYSDGSVWLNLSSDLFQLMISPNRKIESIQDNAPDSDTFVIIQSA